MSQRSFVRSVKQEAADAPKRIRPTIEFDITTVEDDPDGEPLTEPNGQPMIGPDGTQRVGRILKRTILHATQPDDEAMLVSMVSSGRSDATFADRVGIVYDTFKMSLPEGEYRRLMARVKDPNDEVDTMMLTEIFEWLEEQWADFPTQPLSDSSRQPQSTGKSSTGRSRSRASGH